MNNPALDQLKKKIIASLQNKYGYCGCADMPNKAIINSGGDDEDFRITIEDCSEVDGAAGDVATPQSGACSQSDPSSPTREETP